MFSHGPLERYSLSRVMPSPSPSPVNGGGNRGNRGRPLATVAFLFLIAMPGVLRAGAWTLPQNSWYVEEAISFFSSDKDIDAKGEASSKAFRGVYDEVRLKTYVEYGLRDRWTLIFAAPYRRARFVDDYNDISNGGFTDASAAVKWRWKPNPWVVSFGASLGLPTGYDAAEPLALGTGRGNAEARVYVSRLFDERLMLTAEVAKDRVGVPYLIEAAGIARSIGFLKIMVNGLADFPHHSDAESYAKWNLSAGLTSEGSNAMIRYNRQKSTSVSIGMGRVFHGKNTGSGTDLSLSVAFVF